MKCLSTRSWVQYRHDGIICLFLSHVAQFFVVIHPRRVFIIARFFFVRLTQFSFSQPDRERVLYRLACADLLLVTIRSSV